MRLLTLTAIGSASLLALTGTGVAQNYAPGYPSPPGAYPPPTSQFGSPGTWQGGGYPGQVPYNRGGQYGGTSATPGYQNQNQGSGGHPSNQGANGFGPSQQPGSQGPNGGYSNQYGGQGGTSPNAGQYGTGGYTGRSRGPGRVYGPNPAAQSVKSLKWTHSNSGSSVLRRARRS